MNEQFHWFFGSWKERLHIIIKDFLNSQAKNQPKVQYSRLGSRKKYSQFWDRNDSSGTNRTFEFNTLGLLFPFPQAIFHKMQNSGHLFRFRRDENLKKKSFPENYVSGFPNIGGKVKRFRGFIVRRAHTDSFFRYPELGDSFQYFHNTWVVEEGAELTGGLEVPIH